MLKPHIVVGEVVMREVALECGWLRRGPLRLTLRCDTMPRSVLFSTLPKATIFPNATAASLPCNFCARWRARARRTPKPVLLVAATVLGAVVRLLSVARRGHSSLASVRSSDLRRVDPIDDRSQGRSMGKSRGALPARQHSHAFAKATTRSISPRPPSGGPFHALWSSAFAFKGWRP